MGVFCLCYFKFPYHGVRDKRKLCETHLGFFFIVGQIAKSLDYLDCVNVGFVLVCGKKEDSRSHLIPYIFCQVQLSPNSEPLPSFAYIKEILHTFFFQFNNSTINGYIPEHSRRNTYNLKMFSAVFYYFSIHFFMFTYIAKHLMLNSISLKTVGPRARLFRTMMLNTHPPLPTSLTLFGYFHILT